MMLGGKTSSAVAPTALGTLLNASTYGATIPSIIGTTRGGLLPIWAAHLRKGSSSKKSKKKGVTTYVENIDALIGSNPLEGILQIWANNTSPNTLTFKKITAAIAPTITISDSNFYFVVAVTANVGLSGTLNDYGAPGSTTYAGSYEMPLWNVNNPGPDLVNSSGARWYPFVFDWLPAYGNVVKFVSGTTTGAEAMPGFAGTVNIYYAQLNQSTKHKTPLAFYRLAWEEQLGKGDEYSDASLSAQQIIYPMYAGVESSDLDLGATGMIPDLRIEIKGSHALYSQGDADFADMIEDVMKSGQLQVGSELGIIQRGLNCNDLPAPVQKAVFYQAGAGTLNLAYRQPNHAGSVLLAMAAANPGAGGAPSISDDASDAWTPVYVSTGGPLNFGMWHAISVGHAPGNKVDFGFAGSPAHPFELILEMDPDSNDIDAAASHGGTSVAGFGNSCSITTTGKEDLIIAMFSTTSGSGSSTVSPHWMPLLETPLDNNGFTNNNAIGIYSRKVNGPGTYKFDVSFDSAGEPFAIAMIAITNSQPKALPKTLGNILDEDSLLQVRLQCRANGLIGSINMNQQRKASDWLEEFYKCANAAPVWSGFKLKSIARSEVSTVGNGVVYTTPTAAGPVAVLTEDDFVGDSSKPIVTVTRKAQVDANNIVQVQHVNRSNAYNDCTVSEPESAAIANFGPRKLAPKTLREVQDPSVARAILSVEIHRLNYLRNGYAFTLKGKWPMLEAMDLILINDSQQGISNLPVRLTTTKETPSFEIQCEAEPYVYGVNAPTGIQDLNPGGITGVFGELFSSGGNAPFATVTGNTPVGNVLAIWVASVPAGVGRGIVVGTGGTWPVLASSPGNCYQNIPNPGSVTATEGFGAITNFCAAIITLWGTVGGTPSVIQANSITPGVGGARTLHGTTEGSTLVLLVSGEPALYGTAYPNPMFGEVVSSTPPLEWKHVGHAEYLGTISATDEEGIDFWIAQNTVGGDITIQFDLTNQPPGWTTPPQVGGVVLEAGSLGNFTPPSPPPTTPTDPNVPDSQNLPALVNAPVILEPPLRMCTSGKPELWIVISDSDPKYGGCVVLVSSDGGSSYVALGTINGNATTGVVTSDWPSATDPDGTNPLEVDLTESLGSLDSYTAIDENLFTFPCFVETTLTSPPAVPDFELMTYQGATLTAPHKYTLPASGPAPLRRAVFGIPTPGDGSDHASGTRFAWLNNWQASNAPGILKVQLDPSWVGTVLKFKFLQFNTLAGGTADQSAVTPWDYQPIGLASMVVAGQTPYTISGGALTNPTGTSIHMATATAKFAGNSAIYNARTFTITNPSAPTTYYVTVYDPQQIGDNPGATNLSAQCQTSNSLISQPGYVYIGSITALPGGGGTSTAPGGYPPPEQILVNGA